MVVDKKLNQTLYMVVSKEEDMVYSKFNGDYLYTRERSADRRAEMVGGKVLICKLSRIN